MIENFVKPRVLFALMFYGTFLFMCLKGSKIPTVLENLVIALMSYYFGRSGRKKEDNV